MYYYLLGAIGSLCILCLDVDAEECIKSILNRRETYNAVFGERLSLSCIVQHCGEMYTCRWIWKNSTYDAFVSVSRTKHQNLNSENLSSYKTRHILDLEKVSELDQGYYGCRVEWNSTEIDQGHMMHVNVLAAVSTDRKAQHRILVYFGLALCLAVVLGLAFCLRSKVRKFNPASSPCPMPCPSAEYHAPLHQSTPQPLPRRKAPEGHCASAKKTPYEPKPKTEVVYADISQDALHQQQQRLSPQSEQPSIIYSSVRFA